MPDVPRSSAQPSCFQPSLFEPDAIPRAAAANATRGYEWLDVYRATRRIFQVTQPLILESLRIAPPEAFGETNGRMRSLNLGDAIVQSCLSGPLAAEILEVAREATRDSPLGFRNFVDPGISIRQEDKSRAWFDLGFNFDIRESHAGSLFVPTNAKVTTGAGADNSAGWGGYGYAVLGRVATQKEIHEAVCSDSIDMESPNDYYFASFLKDDNGCLSASEVFVHGLLTHDPKYFTYNPNQSFPIQCRRNNFAPENAYPDSLPVRERRFALLNWQSRHGAKHSLAQYRDRREYRKGVKAMEARYKARHSA